MTGPVLPTTVDPNSDDYAARATHNIALVTINAVGVYRHLIRKKGLA